MIQKKLIMPDRVRRLPVHWSWVDHRLVRERHLQHCEAPAWALYLFLIAVGDAQGLSYYSEASIIQRLPVDAQPLKVARKQLIQAGLIAYAKPLYQVLDLTPAATLSDSAARGQTRSLQEVLRQALNPKDPS